MTPEQKRIIIQQFPHIPSKDVAKLVGMSKATVDRFAHDIGLKKSKKYMEQEKERRIQMCLTCTNKATFKVGSTPHNKGKKISREHYEGISHLFFKKGNATWNEKYDGYERINPEGYTEVRIAPKVFKLKQRIIWIEANGEIPKDHLITFRDGNKQNFALENLECISKSENMRRNKLQNWPLELQTSIVQLNKINRKIKQRNEK
jgi:hypothetical protein